MLHRTLSEAGHFLSPISSIIHSNQSSAKPQISLHLQNRRNIKKPHVFLANWLHKAEGWLNRSHFFAISRTVFLLRIELMGNGLLERHSIPLTL